MLFSDRQSSLTGVPVARIPHALQAVSYQRFAIFARSIREWDRRARFPLEGGERERGDSRDRGWGPDGLVVQTGMRDNDFSGGKRNRLSPPSSEASTQFWARGGHAEWRDEGMENRWGPPSAGRDGRGESIVMHARAILYLQQLKASGSAICHYGWPVEIKEFCS